MVWESKEQSKWERLAAVVESGAAENVLRADACSHVAFSNGRREIKVRMTDWHVAGSTWQVADVKRPLTSTAKIFAAGNRVHLDSKDPRRARPKGDISLAEVWKGVRHRSISVSGKTRPAGGGGFIGMRESRSLRRR